MDTKKIHRRPIILQLMIYGFMIAPIGNLMLTSLSLGQADWYHLENLLAITREMKFLESAWLGFIFISGTLLMIRHQTAWTVAILTLSLTLLINFRNLFHLIQFNDLSLQTILPLVFSLGSTLAVGVVFFYFRYPYLDRRSTLFGFAPRVDTNLECVVTAGQNQYSIACHSLSISGARFDLKDLELAMVQKEVISIKFIEGGIELEASVVQNTKEALRIKFSSMDSTNRGLLARMIRKIKYGHISEGLPNKLAA